MDENDKKSRELLEAIKDVCVGLIVMAVVAWVAMKLWNLGPAAQFDWPRATWGTCLFFIWAWTWMTRKPRGAK